MLYFYFGKLTNRKKTNGIIAARNESEAHEKLEYQAVASAKLIKLFEFKFLEKLVDKSQILKKIKKKNMAYLFTQMGFLIKSGINTYDAIEVLSVSVNTVIAKYCRKLKDSLSQGSLFSDALDKSGLIPKDITEKIRAGEESNSMDEALDNVAQKLKEEMELSSSIKAGLAYPIFSLVVIFAMAMFMLIVLVPQIGVIVADFGAELPALTKFLIACSDAIVKYWWMMLIIITVIVVVHIRLYKTKDKYKYIVDKYFYKIPLLGNITKKLHLIYLSSVMSQLMNSGKNQADAIILVKETVTNSYLYETMKHIEENVVRKGLNLYEAMKDYDVFPAEFLQMIAIGTRTGNITEVLENIYNQYRYEAKDDIKAATDLLQPISLMIIGVVAGVFVLGMYSAIYCIFGAV